MLRGHFCLIGHDCHNDHGGVNNSHSVTYHVPGTRLRGVSVASFIP